MIFRGMTDVVIVKWRNGILCKGDVEKMTDIVMVKGMSDIVRVKGMSDMVKGIRWQTLSG